MFATHWFRLLALLIYVGGVGVVLHHCARQFNPPSPPPAPKERPPPLPDLIVRQQHDRAVKRAAFDDELRRRKTAHDALEAELKALREIDLSRAVAELSREALRYTNKVSDLARLELAERWERENAVKDARAHAYKLVLEHQALDQQAQKEREGPTLYQDDAVALITRRLEEFRRGGEAIASFAAAVPAFAGQVPEKLLLEAIDAITLAVLPADAFDECRNPAACPKETPPQVLAPPPAPKEKLVSLRVVSWARDRDMVLRYTSEARSPAAGSLKPGELVKATGRTSQQYFRNGPPIKIIELMLADGTTRWALESIFEKPEPQVWPDLYRRVPSPSRRSRQPDYFSGMFGWD